MTKNFVIIVDRKTKILSGDQKIYEGSLLDSIDYLLEKIGVEIDEFMRIAQKKEVRK